MLSTIQEMHYDLSFKLDKVDSIDSRNLLPAEKDWILNEAQEIILKQRYRKDVGFEVDQKRIDDLRTLVIKSPSIIQPGLVPVNVGDPAGFPTTLFEVALDNLAFDYVFLIRGSALITKTNCGSKTIGLSQIQHDDWTEMLKSPFEKPSYQWEELPAVFGAEVSVTPSNFGSIFLETAGDFTINQVYLEYIKEPVRMSIGGYTYIDGTTAVLTECEFPDHMKREIVDVAVNEIDRIIGDPRFRELTKEKLQIHE